ncbi:5-oxoprolinase (ATP-hydrolyzing) [Candidatus Koribacter versatilis Ellin345]|uniref:5-oxoprolinase (ATP-hydrolyzing) n=1 Tax=Koribacter versatilis (strain Ellin345) TaxID=204669 RepID=Q1IJM9_KORVE|nr:hydantoinase B/oxoprolinase family protein [Candidatus Koribacter versatilis]ABF42921.1 5-oxoprolinase (ATP-hydrolyzing) [Candidatus Koribacter versatilis Ellin345]
MARKFDPIELEIFKSIFHSIAEEMGAALRRTAFSPNIKERRDYSCAVFDAAGHALAMGDHMPVHLGSMPMSVAAALQDLVLEPGDVAMVNDPFRGGTHLPDITFVAPVFIGKNKKPDFFVASRAHHADVGGTFAGSMGLCSEIYQEGFRIPPVKLVRRGKMDRDLLALLLANVRTPREREGDLSAQIAACHTGETRLREVCARYGLARVQQAADALLDYSEAMMQSLLAQIPVGSYEAEDFLDDDGAPVAGTSEVHASKPVRIAVKLTFAREKKRNVVTVDFTGTDPQVSGSTNAVEAITYSACFYVFRCLLAEDVPATSGLMRPVRLIAPKGTVVNARPPAAVAGGNVETSQRIVDVLLRALAKVMPERIPAASSGTMNNLTIGGIDPRTGEPFAYYETIAGGSGANTDGDGASGLHTHMTNSLNTPAEALEYAYPFRVTRYGIRRGSGGAGKHCGGDGIVREIEVLTDAQVTLLSERRTIPPYGAKGGSPGSLGKAAIVGSEARTIPGKATGKLKKGERIRVETPGGGGWGR